MKRLIALILFALLLYGCDSHNVPPQQRIDQEVSENNWQVLLVKEVDSSIAAVLYKSDEDYGCFFAWSDINSSGGKRVTTDITFARDNKWREQPAIILNDYFDGFDFVCVIINDETLLSKSTTIEVTFLDGSKVRSNVAYHEGAIIFRQTNNDSIGYRDVVFFDKGGQILLSVPFDP